MVDKDTDVIHTTRSAALPSIISVLDPVYKPISIGDLWLWQPAELKGEVELFLLVMQPSIRKTYLYVVYNININVSVNESRYTLLSKYIKWNIPLARSNVPFNEAINTVLYYR